MEHHYEKIEGYLLGELAEGELAAFENALNSDTALAHSVAQHREMMGRLAALRLRNKVESAIAPQRIKPAPMYADRKFWALAASLILLVAAVWFFNQPSQPETPPRAPVETPAPKHEEALPAKEKEKPAQLIAFAREFHEQPSQSFVRDATQQDDAAAPKTPLQLAAKAYENKKYRLALKHLQLLSITEQDEEARYLRANARFQIGNFSGAASDFNELEDSFQFKHEARWNFLLCQIALGKTEPAKTRLAAMVADEDFPFRAKALELKSKLKGK